ncbi:MAG: hypothetical protein LBN43_02595 [Oscillospiraceae bacterium]|jgi:hypothetical protein|nr:hypothetical protein [Oscillospiraceae bacterium]
MKKVLTLSLVIALILSGCSNGKSIQRGNWNSGNTVFTNKWSALKLTVPDGFTALTDNELPVFFETLRQDPMIGVHLPYERLTFDAVITNDSGTGLWLVYEDITETVLNADILNGGIETDEDIINGVSQMRGFTGIATQTLAGKTWTRLGFYNNYGELNWRLFFRTTENVRFGIVLLYNDEADAKRLISAIE